MRFRLQLRKILHRSNGPSARVTTTAKLIRGASPTHVHPARPEARKGHQWMAGQAAYHFEHRFHASASHRDQQVYSNEWHPSPLE